MKTIFPNYNNCLTNLSNSILKYFGLKTYHETLKKLDDVLNENNSKNVIVLLYDGMGSKVIDKTLGVNNFFNEHKICDITSVFPATTTAATKSVLTGLNPVEHGWIGWNVYFKDVDKTITLFSNKDKETKEEIKNFNAGEVLSSYKNIIEKINEETDYSAYFISPYSNYKYSSLKEMNDLILDITKKEGKKYIYVYNEEPDYSMHEFGADSKEIKDLMTNILESTKTLCDSLEDTTLIVIADHGHTNVERINIKDYKEFYNCLKRTTSLESRCANFFIKEDKKEEFLKEYKKHFSNDFILFSKKEVLEKHLFGYGKKNKYFDDAIGDFLLVAKSNKYLDDKDDGFIFKSHHAGITEDEVLVPLIVINKK